ncbi:MAG TPA: aspartyl protease family protein [Candidatus Acidoferrales bacterium]|nr:aspartyl protease family protein [Candidatus Acidoferrales bacterium]
MHRFRLRLISLSVFGAMICAGRVPRARETSDRESKPVASASASFKDAEHLYRIHQLDAAVQEYNSLIATGTQPGLAYAGLVRVYLKQNDLPDAIAASAKALAIAPDAAEAHVARGEVYFREGRITDAQEEFAEFTGKGAKNARAYLGMARIYEAESDYQKTREMADEAYDLDPSDPDVQSMWALNWLATVDLQDRITVLRGYLGDDPGDDDMRNELAVFQDEARRNIAPCRLSTNADSLETNLEPVSSGTARPRGYGLKIGLNGVSSTLLLDSGSSGILVSRRIAEKAGIERIASIRIGGVGTNRAAPGYIGYAKTIQVGGLEFRSCYVDVLDGPSVTGGDGLIGADTFSNFLLDLDFRRAKFRLSELPALANEAEPVEALDSRFVSLKIPEFAKRYDGPEMKSFTRAWRFGHDLLIPVNVNESGTMLFLVDTGSAESVISPDAAKKVAAVRADTPLKVAGVNGRVTKVFHVSGVALTFANQTQRNLDLVSFDTTTFSNSIGTEVSGLLGFATLKNFAITIDYRDGLIRFRPHSKT